MNRTIKDATVKRYHHENHDQLRQHLADFVAAYNFGRRLKTLKGTVRISVCGRAVEHYAAMALMKRSPKITAN